jgi:hypothetical protein
LPANYRNKRRLSADSGAPDGLPFNEKTPDRGQRRA